jgi:hypothetical protein
MKQKKTYNDGYWKACLKWVTLRGKQRALFYNPGNALKRKYILNFINDCLQNCAKSRAEEAFLILDVGSGLGDMALDFFSKECALNTFCLIWIKMRCWNLRQD